MIGLRSWATAAVVFAIGFMVWNVIAASVSPLLLLFTAILLAAGLRPVVDGLKARMPYSAAVACAFGSVVVVAVGIGFVLVQPLGVELAKLVSAAPGYAHELQVRFLATQRLVEADPTAKQMAAMLANGAGSAVSSVGQTILGTPAFVATAIGDTLLIVLLAIGWMLSAGELERFVLGVIPVASRADWQAAFVDIGARLSAYVKGIVLNGALVGVAIGGGLALFGIPYALLLGFVAAIFQAIPMVGAVISGIVILLVVLAISGWTKMLIALGLIAIVQAIDQNAVSPIIFGKGVQLSFLLIIFATIVGGTLLGISGAFLAVPIAAVLQVLVVRIVAPALRGTSA